MMGRFGMNRRQTLGVAAGAAAGTSLWTHAVAEGAPASFAPHLLDPGISHELAIHRAGLLSDIRYALTLDLTQRDLAAGSVRMSFRRRGAEDLIVDFRGPTLTDVKANGRTVTSLTWRDGHFIIPARHLTTGVNRLEASFTTPIAASGASVIRFDDKSDGATYLYTLLVPSDANLLFPCFDQPNLKARVTWTLRAPATWSVLANAKAVSRDVDDAGAALWRFAQTEPIPTYLAAFAAGPWATWTSAPMGERPITLYARASRREEVDADVIIASNRDAAKWLAGWFDVPFPFSKLDALLAPAFPFGGMEHVGEIFYNENSFIFREPPTPLQLLGRDSTMYHEVSHQWFGDLVTMQWFDDLWLKEGFATYMSARVQNALKPDNEAWKTFYLREKPVAYAADSTSGTNSVSQPLDNLDQAKSNYGPIVYNKAPAIIKQLAFLVGEEQFRAGLHRFLVKHSYANATWRDLLTSIEGSDTGSLKAFGDQYILRAGMARVDTKLDLQDGKVRRLSLAQRPVRALPNDPGGWWPMKVQVRLGYTDRPDVVLVTSFNGEEAVVADAQGLPAPAYVWANDGDYGYGLFLPDERSAKWIEANVESVTDGLLRAMLWGALWDLVRETRLKPARFVEIALNALPGERDEQISVFILSRASIALTRYVSDTDAERLYPAWETLLASRTQDATLGYGFRKDSLDVLIATTRTSDGRKRLRDYLAGAVLFNGEPVKQLTHWNIAQRLLALGDADGPALVAAEAKRDTTPESGRSAFIVGASAPSAEVKHAYYDRYFNDATLNEEWVSASLAGFNAPDQAELSFPYLRPSLDRLPWIEVHRRIFFLPGWVSAFIGGQHSQAALDTVDRYLADNPSLPIDIRRKVLEARDELERVVAVRKAAGAKV